MNGQTQNKLISVGLIVFAVAMILMVSRAAFILPSMSEDDICRLKYGEYWIYEDNSLFEDTCVELDYISLNVLNRTKQGMTVSEATDKYCEVPGFFELNKWGYKCKNG